MTSHPQLGFLHTQHTSARRFQATCCSSRRFAHTLRNNTIRWLIRHAAQTGPDESPAACSRHWIITTAVRSQLQNHQNSRIIKANSVRRPSGPNRTAPPVPPRVLCETPRHTADVHHVSARVLDEAPAGRGVVGGWRSISGGRGGVVRNRKSCASMSANPDPIHSSKTKAIIEHPSTTRGAAS